MRDHREFETQEVERRMAGLALERELKDADAKAAPPLRASLYLTQFSDEAGRLWAYRKDEPYKALHVRPSEIAFERYCSSRPLDGGRDDNAIKDFFNPLEGEWSRLKIDVHSQTSPT